MKGKKVIICDIDGTLAYSDTEVSNEMLKLIDKLQEKYLFVTMGNGNFTHLNNQFVEKYKENNSKELYVYALGGLECYKVMKDGVLKVYSNDLTNDEKYKLVKTISDFIREYKIKPDTYDQIEDRGSMVVLSILGRKADKELKKKYDPDKKKRKKFINDFFRDRLPEFEMKIGGTTTIDFTKKGLTKAFGVRKIKEMFGYEFDEMIYLGDDLGEGGNDEAVKELIEAIPVKNPEETLDKLRRFL